MKLHKVLLGVFAVAIGVISIKVIADVQLQTFNVDIPAFQGKYTSDSYRKSYQTSQNYKCIGNMSNHDGTRHPILVNLHNNSTGKESGFVKVNIGDSYTFNNSNFTSTDSYKIDLKNETWSIYTYFTSGIWQYSM